MHIRLKGADKEEYMKGFLNFFYLRTKKDMCRSNECKTCPKDLEFWSLLSVSSAIFKNGTVCFERIKTWLISSGLKIFKECCELAIFMYLFSKLVLAIEELVNVMWGSWFKLEWDWLVKHWLMSHNSLRRSGILIAKYI